MSKEVMNMSLSMTQFWLIAIALLLLVEFATSALTTIWFGGRTCMAAGSAVYRRIRGPAGSDKAYCSKDAA